MRTITVAVPTYERTMSCAFERVHDDPRVAEIVVCDDGSAPTTYAVLSKRMAIWPKVTLWRHASNSGSYANKRRAVERTTSDWVALIDSDNGIGPEYLVALFASEWADDTMYVPVYAPGVLDYRKYEGLCVDRGSISQYLDDGTFVMALNTGNFFVNRAGYLRTATEACEESFASDGIYFVWRWLSSGGRVLFMPGLHYHHLVHNGHWMQTMTESENFSNDLVRRMRAGNWEGGA